jgi:hypothetical protein
MINVISTFYISKYNSYLDTDRTNELIQSLKKNIYCHAIEKIHLFVDDCDAINLLISIIMETNTKKIHVIDLKKRPTYNDFFQYILSNVKDKLCMITNADIYIQMYDENILNNKKIEFKSESDKNEMKLKK